MIALYPRVSTQEQALEGYSIDGQIERMKSYCNAMQWTDYKIYTDAGYSGGNMNRPALQNMIRDIKNGKIDKVLVYKLDRLSRSQLDTLYLIEKVFFPNNCDFVSMSENFDTSTPFGRATIGILAVFAQLEREQIKERMMLGKTAKVKEGKFLGNGKPPIGYDFINDSLVINDFEKLAVIEAFDLAEKGLRPNQISKIFDNKYTHNGSDKWQDKTIRALLRNKVYNGYVKFGNRWYKGNHETFIPPEQFERVNQILDDRSDAHRRNNERIGKTTSYIGGLIYCAQCGAKYGIKSTSRKRKDGTKYVYSRFRCYSQTFKNIKSHSSLVHDPNCTNKAWFVDELTDLVFNEIRKLSFDDSYIKEIKKTSGIEKEEILKKELSEANKKIEKLIDLYSIDTIPENILQSKIAKLNETVNRIQIEIDNIGYERVNRLNLSDTIKTVNSFDEILKNGNFDEIRTIIGILIEKIEVDNNDIKIYWKF